jgi:uncharacterized membrane protein YdjX (TVP38/TMEM64 family)
MTLFDVIVFVASITLGYAVAEWIRSGSGWIGGLLGAAVGFLTMHYLLRDWLLGGKKKNRNRERDGN